MVKCGLRIVSDAAVIGEKCSPAWLAEMVPHGEYHLVTICSFFCMVGRQPAVQPHMLLEHVMVKVMAGKAWIISNPLVVTSTAQVKVFSSVEACEHNCALLQDGMKQCTQWTAAVASGIVS
jgi:hypothetical protein